ncbi:archaemetzincin family Zn-dependent metalloprotease [Candidatus Bathyarchaeota archaeon]|nr:archaemetzincin family Zn-dependent metalloprotease [Candidatus Bathyarchaeota archaeon]
MLRILIVPIGQIDLDTLNTLRDKLIQIFPNTDCNILTNEMPIPKQAYNPARAQFFSTQILEVLINYSKQIEADRVLGVTNVDLYVPHLNFVFGEAQCPGRTAIISLHRLQPEFYGFPPDIDLFRARTLKEAVHELGHTFGLKHCQQPKCVMFFSNSILDTDRKHSSFCETCNQTLEKNLEILTKSKTP